MSIDHLSRRVGASAGVCLLCRLLPWGYRVRCGRTVLAVRCVCCLSVGHIGCCVGGEYPVGVSISSSYKYRVSASCDTNVSLVRGSLAGRGWARPLARPLAVAGPLAVPLAVPLVVPLPLALVVPFSISYSYRVGVGVEEYGYSY